VDGNKNIVYRLRPRYNPLAQGHFMCDDGRLGYHYVNYAERYLRPLSKVEGVHSPRSWADAIPAVRSALQGAVNRGASGVVGVISPFLTCEEAYLFASFLKGLSPEVRLALGPVPVIGEDDTYPKDRRGNPVQPVKFTIRAEKCPNRRGVEEVLKHFQGSAISFADVLREAGEGQLQAVYLAASYPPRRGPDGGPWVTEEQARALGKVPLVVCQDLFPSPASTLAHFILPGSAWAEKDGTFVNHSGLAQEIHWAVTPTGECRTDGQVFLDLLGRKGLAHAPTIRKEMAAAVPYFGPLSASGLGEYGIPLK
jgi:NADH-quinone oxidoreductase subunit G